MELLRAPRRDRLSRAELAGRFARRHTRARAPAAASALRILRRPHGRQLWRACPDGRPGPVGIHASLDCHWPADRVPHALDPVVPGDPRPGRVPDLVLALRPDGTAHPAVGRESGSVLEAGGASIRRCRCLSPVRRGRRHRAGRHGTDGRRLLAAEHHPPLSRGKDSAMTTRTTAMMPTTNSCRRDASPSKLVRWCKFNFVGGIGILVQFAALFLLKSVLQFNYLAATAIAVEAAVVHNFVWHEQFTWVDRMQSDSAEPRWRRSLP